VFIACGWYPLLPAPDQQPLGPSGPASWVDAFKEHRRASSKNAGSASFADSMSCVRGWMRMLNRRSPDQMFTKLLFAVETMLNEDPSTRPTSLDSLSFLQSRDWLQLYADQLTDFNLPDDPLEPIDEGLPFAKVSTEGLGHLL
jgi:hypothetical protein